MAGPYVELTGDAFFVTCKPVVDNTNTEDVWRSKAGTGRFVKTVTAQINSRNHGLLSVTLSANNDALVYGRLESVQGSGDSFVCTVCVLGADMYAAGSVTGNGALSATDIGQTLQGGGDGKLKVAAGGFGKVVGGNVTDLRIAFNGILNVE